MVKTPNIQHQASFEKRS